MKKLLFLLLTLIGIVSYGQNTTQNGKWSLSTNWSSTPSGTSGSCSSGSASSGTCNAPLNVQHILLLDQNISITSGVYYFNANVIDPAGGTAQTLSVSNTSYSATAGILDIQAGSTTFEGAATISNATVYVRAGATLTTGALTISNTGKLIVDGTVIVNGTLTDNPTTKGLTVNNGGYVQVNGNYTSNTTGGFTTSGTGQVLTTGSLQSSTTGTVIVGSVTTSSDCTTGPCAATLLVCPTTNTTAFTGTLSAAQTKCGSSATAISLTSSGSVTSRQWQSSTTNAGTGFSDISGSTGTTYTPPSTIALKTWYRCKFTLSNAGCTTATYYSNSTSFIPVDAGVDQTILFGSTSATMAGVLPASTTGTWSIVSGPNTLTSQFSSLTATNATFTPLCSGVYTLRFTSSCSSSPTDDMTLTVSDSYSQWTGTSSTAWTTAGNWNTIAPNALTNVTVVSATNQPSITAASTGKSLTVSSGTVTFTNETVPLTLQCGAGLVNNGSLFVTSATPSNDGTVVGGSGYVVGATKYYPNVSLTGGSGSGATADVYIYFGSISNVVMKNTGNGYQIGDVLSAPNSSLGGSGSGFTYTVTKISSGPSISFNYGTQTLSGSGTNNFFNIGVSNSNVTFNSDATLIDSLYLVGSTATFDPDGTSNNKVFTLQSTNAIPDVTARIGIIPSGASITGKVRFSRYSNPYQIYVGLCPYTDGEYYYGGMCRFAGVPVQSETVSDAQTTMAAVAGYFTGSCTGLSGPFNAWFGTWNCSDYNAPQYYFNTLSTYDETVIMGDATVVGGSGYTNGVYGPITTTLASGPTPTSYPVVNVDIQGGVVTDINSTYVYQPVQWGSGVNPLTDVFTSPNTNIGGTGSGWSLSFNTNVGNLNNGFNQFPVSSNTETFAIGTGYAIQDWGASAGVFDINWKLNGVPVQGNVTVPITYTNSGSIQYNDGWNLVANPYASTIDTKQIGGMSATTGLIYQWSNACQCYNSYNVNTGAQTDPTLNLRYVAAGQAFWVQYNCGSYPCSNGSANLTFTEQCKKNGRVNSTGINWD